MRYAIITGTGRSGTNWTLDILDASPETHCRNEPHGIAGTELSVFPRVWNSESAGSLHRYRHAWDEVAEGVARRCGERDHHIRYAKPYLYPWANYLGLSRAITGPRARRAVGLVDRGLRNGEWELPIWLGSRRRLEDSLGVMKILVDAPLVAWVLEERPHIPIIHIIRHPGGRLHSWLTRLLAGSDDAKRDMLHADRLSRIKFIRTYDEEWRSLIPEPDAMPLVNLELWFWRYVNETTLAAGTGHERYYLLLFDELAKNPVAHAAELYEHLGLRWNETLQHRIKSDTSTSVFGPVDDPQEVARAWRSRLSPQHLDAIDEIVGPSRLTALLT